MFFFGVFCFGGVDVCGVFFFGSRQQKKRGLVRMDDLCHKHILSKEFQAFFFGSQKLLSLGDGWAEKSGRKLKLAKQIHEFRISVP